MLRSLTWQVGDSGFEPTILDAKIMPGLLHCTVASKSNGMTVTLIPICCVADRCEQVMQLSQVQGEMRKMKTVW